MLTAPLLPARTMQNFPFMAIPLLLVNALIFFYAGGLATELTQFTLPSGQVMTVTAGDVVLLVGTCFLFVEIIKSTRIAANSVIDHALSLGLFVVALIEFLLVPAAGNSVFVLIMLMCLLDVIAGFTIGMAVARRDLGVFRE